MREVLALAERTGGIVDHAGSRGLLANVRAMQDGGTVTATLAEVRNRADLVLLVGTDTKAIAPRLIERCLAPSATLFGPIERRLVHLGPAPAVPGAEALSCPAEALGEVLAVLRALAAGGRITAEAVAGLPVASLRDLATRLREARYPVILWAARDLPGNHPDLVTGTLAGLIRDLNAKGRCSGVPLVGPDNIVGVNQVCAWQTGGPLRTSFASGAPDHDPVRWSTSAALAAGAADCLVWISSFGDAAAARLARADHRPGAARARLARRGRGRDPGRHAGARPCRQRLPHGRRGEPAACGPCATPACPASPRRWRASAPLLEAA